MYGVILFRKFVWGTGGHLGCWSAQHKHFSDIYCVTKQSLLVVFFCLGVKNLLSGAFLCKKTVLQPLERSDTERRSDNRMRAPCMNWSIKDAALNDGLIYSVQNGWSSAFIGHLSTNCPSIGLRVPTPWRLRRLFTANCEEWFENSQKRKTEREMKKRRKLQEKIQMERH